MMKSKGVAVCIAVAVVCSGCASFKEKAKGILGISTKSLEELRPSAATKIFPLDHGVCYNRTKAALAAMHAYIYAQDAQQTMIAVYASEQDTTPVGVFFKSITASTTQVEVSSPSSEERDNFSDKLFSILGEQPLAPRLQERLAPDHAAGP